MDDCIVTQDEDNLTFFGLTDEDEGSTYTGDDVHKATNYSELTYRDPKLCCNAGHQRRQRAFPEGARGQVRAARDQEPLRPHPSRGGVLQKERRCGRIANQVSLKEEHDFSSASMQIRIKIGGESESGIARGQVSSGVRRVFGRPPDLRDAR